VRRCATYSACRKLRDTCARSACPPGPTSCAAESAESDGRTRLLRQLDTNRIECCEFSSSSRDLAEIQRLAGRAPDPHYDQIITPEVRLPQDGILGCHIKTQGRSDRRVIAVRQLDDILENGFFAAPSHARPSQAALCGTEPDPRP